MKTALPSPIEALFTRHPALGGFSVRGLDEVPDSCPRGGDGDSGLFVGDVGVSPALPEEEFQQVVDDIIVAVAEVLCERPDAADSLRGRTFARALH